MVTKERLTKACVLHCRSISAYNTKMSVTRQENMEQTHIPESYMHHDDVVNEDL